MITDQINNYRAASESMKKQNQKLQKELKVVKKQANEQKKNLDNAKIDYDIAKDNQTDNENVMKLAAHLKDRTNKLELQNLEEKYDKDIIEAHQKIVHYENENHFLDMQNMRQKKLIEENTVAPKLRKLEYDHKIKLDENHGQFDYIKSRKFTNQNDKIPKILSSMMKEDEMNRCLKSHSTLINEQKKII